MVNERSAFALFIAGLAAFTPLTSAQGPAVTTSLASQCFAKQGTMTSVPCETRTYTLDASGSVITDAASDSTSSTSASSSASESDTVPVTTSLASQCFAKQGSMTSVPCETRTYTLNAAGSVVTGGATTSSATSTPAAGSSASSSSSGASRSSSNTRNSTLGTAPSSTNSPVSALNGAGQLAGASVGAGLMGMIAYLAAFL
ncbi:MAG: hypothetical protein M1820_009101 [Bogoriella megaspora]|nr:MAG: hypothetical protein M1820_009101 [Bogoriella megaspora]